MYESFIEKFGIPDIAVPDLNVFFTEEELKFADQADREEFDRAYIGGIVSFPAEDFIRDAYYHGLISVKDEAAGTYEFCNFHRFLDIFVCNQTEKFWAMPEEKRLALDAWYFEVSWNRKNPDPNVRPTRDVYLTLDETIDFINQHDGPVYVNVCDCRSFLKVTDYPRETCITFHDEPNTFVGRGLGRKISKEEACALVRETEKIGMMHSVNPGTICNCEGGSCYLSRGMRRRKSSGFWPGTDKVISWKEDACVGCGKCVKRCFNEVFAKDGKKITVDTSKCVGCGICASACPKEALSIEYKGEKWCLPFLINPDGDNYHIH